MPDETIFSRAFARFTEMELSLTAHGDLVSTHLGKVVIWHSASESTAIEARKRAHIANAAPVVWDRAVAVLRLCAWGCRWRALIEYNREQDRVTIDENFAQLMSLLASLIVEQRRAVFFFLRRTLEREGRIIETQATSHCWKGQGGPCAGTSL